jgi:hypothetical protein
VSFLNAKLTVRNGMSASLLMFLGFNGPLSARVSRTTIALFGRVWDIDFFSVDLVQRSPKARCTTAHDSMSSQPRCRCLSILVRTQLHKTASQGRTTSKREAPTSHSGIRASLSMPRIHH